MKTARYVIEKAFALILTENADSPLEADEYQDGLDALNAWMASQEALGLRLGYVPCEHITDYVTIPDGALRGLIANLAIDLAAKFGMQVSASLGEQARQGMDAMLRLGVRQVSNTYPRTLPHGSGNTEPTWRTTPFYGDVARCEIVIPSNTKATKFAALNTPTVVLGDWLLVSSQNLRGNVNGRITNVSGKVRRLDYTATLNGSGDYLARLYRNGQTSIASGAIGTTLTGSLELNPLDYLELRIEATSSTNGYVVSGARLELK
jgi:hypothetical protein